MGFWAEVTTSNRRDQRVRWFEDGLAENGFVADRNAEILYQYAEMNDAPDFLAMQARRFVAAKPDLVCADFPFARVLRRATTSIPIVFLSEPDPVGSGLVKEERRPGGNVTGTISVYDAASEKRMELVRELLPTARRVALVADYRDCQAAVRSFPARQRSVAARLGLELVEMDVDASQGRDLATVLDQVARSRPDAILPYGVAGGAADRFARLRDFEMTHRIPLVGDAAAVGVIRFGWDFAEMQRRAVGIVVRILRGARPADTPVDRTSRFRLVVDLKGAREIGITIPPAILLRADRVLE